MWRVISFSLLGNVGAIVGTAMLIGMLLARAALAVARREICVEGH